MEGHINPIFNKLSQVRILLFPTCQRKVLILSQSLEFPMSFQMEILINLEKFGFSPYASLIQNVPLGECP
jgi:hypothetical protein